MTIRKFDFDANFETSTAPTATDPTNPSDPVILDYAERRFTQGALSVADNTALKALDVSDRVNGDLVVVRGTNRAYVYNSTSVLGDDTNYVLQPAAGSGRWLRISDVDPSTLNVSHPGSIEIGVDATIHGDIQIDGDVNIDGTLTVINSTTIEVADANLLLNNGGTQAIANSNVAGVTIEMSDATDARIGYDSSLTSKWKAGEVGTESELITAAGAQTMSGSKTFTQDVAMQQSGLMTELGSTPATPSAGTRKIYATSTGFKQLDSAGLVSDLGGGGSGSGSGEVNAVTDTNAASGTWAASGAGVTVATTTTSSEIPLSPISVSAIKMTPVSGTDYVRYRFTMPPAIKNTKLKLHWYQKPLSGYVDGDFKVEVYKNAASDYTGAYTEFALSTDVSGTSGINNYSGSFETTFDSDSGDYYELRFVRVSGTTALVIEDVIVGPGVKANGAVVGSWTAYTPTFTNMTSGDTQFEYRRIGDGVEIRGKWLLATAAAGTAQVTIPSGLTIGGNQAGRTRCGTGNRGYSTTGKDITVFATTGNDYLTFAVMGDDNVAQNVITDAAGTAMSATGNYLYITTDSIPIAEWQGSGTLNLGESGSEFASNSSSTNAADTTSFAYGESGSVGIIGTTALTASRAKRIRFNTPIQASDRIEVEVFDGLRWEPVQTCRDGNLSYSYQNGSDYGIYLSRVTGSDTDMDVVFGRYEFPIGATYGAAGRDWSAVTAITKWRVRKSNRGHATGFGIVSQNASGLFPSDNSLFDDVTATRLGFKEYVHGTTYNGGSAPTVTLFSGGGTLTTVNYAGFYPYQTQSGGWRCRFNLNVTVSSTSRTSLSLAVNGLVSHATIDQAFSAVANTAAAVTNGSNTTNNTGRFTMNHQTATATNYGFSGDIALASKPTWAY